MRPQQTSQNIQSVEMVNSCKTSTLHLNVIRVYGCDTVKVTLMLLKAKCTYNNYTFQTHLTYKTVKELGSSVTW